MKRNASIIVFGLAILFSATGCSSDISSPKSHLDRLAGVASTLLVSDITVASLTMPSGINVAPQAVSAAGYIFGTGENAAGQFVPYVWQSPYSGTPASMASQGFAGGQGANDYGEAGGQISSGSVAVPGYWSSNGGGWNFIPVSTGGLSSITIKDINNSRELVGFRSGSAQLALYWSSPTAEPVVLPMPSFSGNLTGANTQAINDVGDIVGYAVEAKPTGKHTTITAYHAVVWHRDSQGWHATILPQLGSDDRAYDINNAGQIVGNAGGGASLWTNNGGVYSGTIIVSSQGSLSRIDRCGRVIGYSTGTRVENQRAWIWDNGTLVYLPSPSGFSGSTAAGITTDAATGTGVITGVAYSKSSRTSVRWSLPGCPP